MSTARQTVDRFLKAQKEAGVRRRDVALSLFKKGYTEAQVGEVMGVHAKTAHAMKIDFSKSGKEARAKTGKRVHLDPKDAHVKGGGLMYNQFIKAVNELLGA